MQFKKVARQIIVVAIAIIIGFIIGWRTTVVKGIISFDKKTDHIGYFTVFGVTDQYYID